MADPARLAALFAPSLAVPKLGPVHGAAKLGPGPAVTDIWLSTGASSFGASSLGAPLPGLRLKTAALRAATLDAPATLSARLRRGGAEAGLVATLPSLQRLAAAGPAQLLPIDATLSAGGATLTLRGEASRAGLPAVGPRGSPRRARPRRARAAARCWTCRGCATWWPAPGSAAPGTACCGSAVLPWRRRGWT